MSLNAICIRRNSTEDIVGKLESSKQGKEHISVEDFMIHNNWDIGEKSGEDRLPAGFGSRRVELGVMLQFCE